MLLIGLTGSIGMGKSTTAGFFAEEGVPVYDADAAVHRLYAAGGAAVAPLEAAFPGIAVDGTIDRARLSARVVDDPNALKRLEEIVHPLVRQVQIDWLAARDAAGAEMVVLDIPLLFETGGDALVDVTVVATAAAQKQRERVLARAGMTPEKFEAILAKQMPDAEKRAKADFTVDTGLGFDAAHDQVRAILGALKGREGRIWTSRS